MTAFSVVVAVLSVAFVVFMVALQVVIRRRSAAMVGQSAQLPGELGQRIAGSPHALVYFYSQSCAACRSITPRVRALEAKHPQHVFAIDVGRDLELARALHVMATPSTYELSQGTIRGAHIGPIPEAVLARFVTLG